MSHLSQQVRFCISRDGTRLAYAICGSGPPLLWVGHFSRHIDYDWDSPVWGPWLRLLTRRHTLVRYDIRGCGLSDREPVDISLDKLSEDFNAVVAAAGLDRFSLFAMAGNSQAAVAYAVRNPAALIHLVLYGCHTRGPFVRPIDAAQEGEDETRLKAIQLGWRTANPAFARFFTTLHAPDLIPRHTTAYNELLRATTSPNNAAALIRAYWHSDLRTLAPQILSPTLVIHARYDPIIPFDEGRLGASLIPGAQFVSLESRNHVLIESEPAWVVFTRAVDRFLSCAGPSNSNFAQLTSRECAVLSILAKGVDNSGIAAQLGISEKTVRNHVSIIFGKLGAHSRAQAVALARDWGIGPDDP